LLVLVAAVALGWNLSGYRLFDPDEGSNASETSPRTSAP